MADRKRLGRSEVFVPALGLGVMTWGEASGIHRLMPAKAAYGGAISAEEQAAFVASMAADVNFFDTAAMYSGGASERRLGELASPKMSSSPRSSRPARYHALRTCRQRLTPASAACGDHLLIFISTTSRRAELTSQRSWD